MLNYQGRVVVNGTNYHGTGLLKFALGDLSFATNYWSNDGTAAGEPANAVTQMVDRGLLSVRLGDTTIANMVSIPGDAFARSNVWLRVWFQGEGDVSPAQLSPDKQVLSVGYAMVAGAVTPGAVPLSGLKQGNALVNQVIRWDGSEWVASDDTGTGPPARNLDVWFEVPDGGFMDARQVTMIGMLLDTNAVSEAIPGQKTPGAQGVGTLVVQRKLDGANEWRSWLHEIRDGSQTRRTIVLEVREAGTGSLLAGWELQDAWPAVYELVPEYSVGGAGVEMRIQERVTFAFDYCVPPGAP